MTKNTYNKDEVFDEVGYEYLRLLAFSTTRFPYIAWPMEFLVGSAKLMSMIEFGKGYKMIPLIPQWDLKFSCKGPANVKIPCFSKKTDFFISASIIRTVSKIHA